MDSLRGYYCKPSQHTGNRLVEFRGRDLEDVVGEKGDMEDVIF
jgi:hypothetical protein